MSRQDHRQQRVLANILEGHGVRTETGLDRPTRTALTAITRAHLNATEELVEAARRSFAGQLDGSDAARWREESDRKLRERAAELKRPNQHRICGEKPSLESR